MDARGLVERPLDDLGVERREGLAEPVPLRNEAPREAVPRGPVGGVHGDESGAVHRVEVRVQRVGVATEARGELPGRPRGSG